MKVAFKALYKAMDTQSLCEHLHSLAESISMAMTYIKVEKAII